jgi:uncharacterized membrane protein YhaH (DUF805 family)
MLNYLLGFSGRITRKGYLLGQFVVAPIAALLTMAAIFLVCAPFDPGREARAVISSLGYSAAVIVYAWILSAMFFKRLHDFSRTNQRKWRFLRWVYFGAALPFLAIASFKLIAIEELQPSLLALATNLIFIVPAFIGHEPGPNRFGPDPRDPTAGDSSDATPGPRPAALSPNAARIQEMARAGRRSALGALPTQRKAAFGKRV